MNEEDHEPQQILTLADFADSQHAPRSVDPGCDGCGTCICHDGCADPENPLQPDDCETCGACADCIADCAADRAKETHGEDA